MLQQKGTRPSDAAERVGATLFDGAADGEGDPGAGGYSRRAVPRTPKSATRSPWPKRLTTISRRHRDDPDALRESAREDRFSSDRIDEVRQSREETAEPLYDRYTGERLDEAGQEHEAGHDLGGGRGRGLSP